ncbi:unnamed protein product [Pieris macdunnoughi]|uniref:Uncharacterized protein n=1 Tax=Pieris macdunnoughi TaxID=345717 RepID=A0A821WWN9_9NEOP|nr:unnamed protein product [Pieris macdunnoughi]
MHFWIDKRQSQCYSGRHRVPSSLSAGGLGRSRGRVGVSAPGGRKGMAAPVHRFVPVDCAPRRPRVPRATQYGPPPIPQVHTSRRTEESMYVEIPVEPPQPTIASLAAARSVTPDTLLRTAALGLQHSPMMAPHLKFGLLVSLALATLFIACVKYYFDRQMIHEAGSSDTGLVCAAIACVSGAVCALSRCLPRAPVPPAFPPDRVSTTGTRERMAPSEPSEDVSLATLLQNSEGSAGGSCSSEAPPPYHIAVLLPGRDQPSPPPPAYSALS